MFDSKFESDNVSRASDELANPIRFEHMESMLTGDLGTYTGVQHT